MLLRSLFPLAPVLGLLVGAIVLFSRTRSVWTFLQVLGSAGLSVVVLAHICEALHILPEMGWGSEASIGHYVDLSGAILGLLLFPVGYVVDAFRTRNVGELPSNRSMSQR